jgi:hypothetical protein
MTVTINVFYAKDGGKRGSPVTNAAFAQLFQEPKHAPGFPGATTPVDLAIIQRTGGQYVIAPTTDPMNTSAYTIRISTPGSPEIVDVQPARSGDMVDVGIREGETADVLIGYER